MKDMITLIKKPPGRREQSSSRNYTSNDLTILKAMEWDRLNFTDPEKRKNM